MMKIDINSDLGEGAGNDEAVMEYISSANIACGYHAGDADSMYKTIQLALKNNVAIGAHPGYDDKENFGRTAMDLSPSEVKRIVKDQLETIKTIAERLGAKIEHIKAHGALYNQAASNQTQALAIAEAVYEMDPKLIFVGLANSLMIDVAKGVGLRTASEVFADRAYTNEGFLVPRGMEGAVIHDADICKKRVLKMLRDSVVESIDGVEIAIQADTVCIHGDNPQALELAKAIHDYLLDNGVEIRSMSKLNHL